MFARDFSTGVLQLAQKNTNRFASLSARCILLEERERMSVSVSDRKYFLRGYYTERRIQVTEGRRILILIGPSEYNVLTLRKLSIL